MVGLYYIIPLYIYLRNPFVLTDTHSISLLVITQFHNLLDQIKGTQLIHYME